MAHIKEDARHRKGKKRPNGRKLRSTHREFRAFLNLVRDHFFWQRVHLKTDALKGLTRAKSCLATFSLCGNARES
eukprot:4800647-Karenia_brevis.AAC.1